MTILNHSIVGTGSEVVIVLHEWLGDHTNYDNVLPYLNTDKYKWVFVDLRGYGLSKQLTGHYTCNEASNDIEFLIKELGFKKVSIVGHSMSAMIAQKFVVDNPVLVKKLVLVTPVPASGIKLNEVDENYLRDSVFDDSKIRNAINLRTGERYNSAWLDTKLNLANNASTKEARAGYLEMFLKTDFREKVKGLKLPVRVIVGKYDIPVFQKEAVEKLFSEWFHDLIIVECNESGHYPMLECPVYFASMLEKLLSNAKNC